jgi:hypothetical protein
MEVAEVQQEFYTQLINNPHNNNAGQLVGEWQIRCVRPKNIRIVRLETARYADMH